MKTLPHKEAVLNTLIPTVHTNTHAHTQSGAGLIPLGCSPLLSWCFLSSLSETGSWWPRAEDRASRLAAVPAPGCRGGCRPAGCGVSGTGMAWPWERC